MAYEYLSILSSILVAIGYLPEYYILIKNKKVKFENIYIWLIWTCGSMLSVIYGILNKQYFLMATQYTVVILNFSTLLLKLFYYYNSNNNIIVENIRYDDLT
jgi:uncharacterized protein with PQ loop repeat